MLGGKYMLYHNVLVPTLDLFDIEFFLGMVILVVSMKCMIHKREFLVYYSSNECV
jgi:hypothetical protein